MVWFVNVDVIFFWNINVPTATEGITGDGPASPGWMQDAGERAVLRQHVGRLLPQMNSWPRESHKKTWAGG